MSLRWIPDTAQPRIGGGVDLRPGQPIRGRQTQRGGHARSIEGGRTPALGKGQHRGAVPRSGNGLELVALSTRVDAGDRASGNVFQRAKLNQLWLGPIKLGVVHGATLRK